MIILPSLGIHPSRLIIRDGSLMWKHALLYEGVMYIPRQSAIEAKTAQRLEASCWLWEHGSVDDGHVPSVQVRPKRSRIRPGISVYLEHRR